MPSQPLSQPTKKNSFGSDQQMKPDAVTSVAGRKVQRSGPDDGKKNLDSSQTRLPSSASMQSNVEPVSNSKQSCKEPAEVGLKFLQFSFNLNKAINEYYSMQIGISF